MIYLIGYMGVGKTTIGKLLSEILQLPFFDTDQIIEQQEQKSINDIFNQNGESYFRSLETALIRQYNGKGIMACGGGVAINNNNIKIMKHNGISIYLKASTNYLYNQLKDRKKERPLIHNISNKKLEKYIKKDLAQRNPFYQLAQHIIEVDKKNKTEILREINAFIFTL